MFYFVCFFFPSLLTLEWSDFVPGAVAAGVACAWCCWVAPLGLCVLPLCMRYCNEATSLNCSEGWLSQREAYYTLGSICTRLFFLLLLLHPIFLTPSLPDLLLDTDSPCRGAWRTRQTSLFFSDDHTNHHSVSKPDSPGGSVFFMDSDWLYWVQLYCSSLQLPTRVGGEEDRVQVTLVYRCHYSLVSGWRWPSWCAPPQNPLIIHRSHPMT